MDKEWIESTITHGMEYIEFSILEGEEVLRCIGSIAELIAQAHEQDKRDALKVLSDTWHDIEDEHLAELAQRQAQVAVMAEALENLVRIRKHIPSECARRDNRTDGGLDSISRGLRCEIDDMDKAWQKVDKALSAAPKLVWKSSSQDSFRLMHYVEPDETQIEGPDLNDIVMAGLVGEDGQEIEVFVCLVNLGCQPKGEQGQESEQEE